MSPVDCAHGIPLSLSCGACEADKGIAATLAVRASRYGDFTSQAALTQSVLDIWSATPVWATLDPVKKSSLFYIADKVARALNGDPEYTDNWHDIGGYAKLVEDRCKP